MARKRYAKELDDQTTQLLKRLGLLSAPVDVESVAAKLGASVVRDELEDDVSGFLLTEKGTTTIAVNSRHHPNRQRFTIAHECGHLHLHAGQGDRLWVEKAYFFRNSTSSSGDHQAEIQANQFAAGLLMPESLINEYVDGRTQLSEADIARLAIRFEVSERAMTLRIISLGLMEAVAA